MKLQPLFYSLRLVCSLVILAISVLPAPTQDVRCDLCSSAMQIHHNSPSICQQLVIPRGRPPSMECKVSVSDQHWICSNDDCEGIKVIPASCGLAYHECDNCASDDVRLYVTTHENCRHDGCTWPLRITKWACVECRKGWSFTATCPLHSVHSVSSIHSPSPKHTPQSGCNGCVVL